MSPFPGVVLYLFVVIIPLVLFPVFAIFTQRFHTFADFVPQPRISDQQPNFPIASHRSFADVQGRY